MRATCHEYEDKLVLRLFDKPIEREAPQDWSTHISYVAVGTIVQIVCLDASAQGVLPPKSCTARRPDRGLIDHHHRYAVEPARPWPPTAHWRERR